MGVIYKITNPKGNIYIGQTVDYKKRLGIYRTLHCKKQRMLYNSFVKYGFASHSFDLLEENVEPKALNEREVFWIAEYNSCNLLNRKGMNMNKGGNTPVWDKDRIDKFADGFMGDRNPFFGKTHTVAVKKILSDKAKIYFKGKKPSRLAIQKGAEAKMRKVSVYGNDGYFLFKCRSLTECSKKLGVDVTTIRDSVQKGAWIKGTYMCKYWEEGMGIKINVGIIHLARTKRAVLFLDNKHQVVSEYKSSKEASEFFNIPCTTINYGCLKYNMKPLRSGHIFIYKDLYKPPAYCVGA